MKACIACKYFRVDPGYCYSEYTQQSTTIHCDKHHFVYESTDSVVTITLEKAINCPDFELSDLAIEKGWTP